LQLPILIIVITRT